MISRRNLLKASALPWLGGLAWGQDSQLVAPPVVGTGDPTPRGIVLWGYSAGPARVSFEVSRSPDFVASRMVPAGIATEASGYTAKVYLPGPLAGQYYYRMHLSPLAEGPEFEPVLGSFRVKAPGEDVRFLWSGDNVGQGYGINPEWGGLRIYRQMLSREPDFLLHSGDYIYADGPLSPELELPDGSLWRNLVTPAKSKVAESLEEFRGNYTYNFLDQNFREFMAAVPQVVQWDDHETMNNWYPGEVLADERYRETSVNLLAARALQAFLEYTPAPMFFRFPQRIYRKLPYGPWLEVFILDLRSYRSQNSTNRGAEDVILGREQLDWLKHSLYNSRAVWKVIACDMPIGLIVPDGEDFEAVANAENGSPAGREREFAELLSFIKHAPVKNTVWLTADVHYTAAHRYDPAQAGFKDFNPFYEFVSGPLHAGTFGPSELDATFGPQVLYQKAPALGESNLAPSAGLQFFGEVTISALGHDLSVILRDLTGAELYQIRLEAE